ncbi:MAG: RimK/LysX family protein [Rhodothermales bacterium]|nr:RimK/LysX family protein [Rhodothermales bacterium]
MKGRVRTVTASQKIVVGWREFVSLPEWGIRSIRAKLDTGARTSALHVENLELLTDGTVRFEVVPGGDLTKRVPVVAELTRVTRVRPSTGKLQRRYVVSTVMRLGTVEKVIQLSLVSRRRMLCRMLIGRRALEDDFLVDPNSKYVLGRAARRHASKRPRS